VLEEIIQEHLIGGRVVQKYLLLDNHYVKVWEYEGGTRGCEGGSREEGERREGRKGER
jgi:hypothetical protein